MSDQELPAKRGKLPEQKNPTTFFWISACSAPNPRWVLIRKEPEVLRICDNLFMPGGGGTDVAQDEKVHEDGEIVNGEVSGSHCVISF